MDFIYIFSIIIGSIFFAVLIIASLVVHSLNVKEHAKMQSLFASYQSDNAGGMDYSESAYEEFYSTIERTAKEETSQISIFDIVKSTATTDSDSYDIIDNDGMEEIKGNYEG